MSITRELVGISTAAMPTLPVDLTSLSTHTSGAAFLSTQLRRLFFLTKIPQQWLDCADDGLLQLLLHLLDNLLALFTFQFPGQKLNAPRRSNYWYSLLYHVGVLQLSFSRFFPPLFLTLSKAYTTEKL